MANKLLLRYDLQPKIYGFTNGFIHHSECIDELIISDSFDSNGKYKNIKEGLGDYKVSICSEIATEIELNARYEKIELFVNTLDRAWLYSCGHPLTKKIFNLVGPYIKPIDGSIVGWDGNYTEIERELNKGRAHCTFSFQQLSHSVFSDQILEKALRIYEKLLESDEILKTLINLHFSAHKTDDGYSRIFFFAKSLELVRNIMEGRSDCEKEKMITNEVRDLLHFSFHDLFQLANERFESRHIYDKKRKSLLPKMTTAEVKNFIVDADLIIQSVVCGKLNVPIVLVKRE